MYDPILVTLLKMQPHYIQSSRENGTPSGCTSPLASYQESTHRAPTPPFCSFLLLTSQPSPRRLITLTETLIIPDITKTESNDCFIIHCVPCDYVFFALLSTKQFNIDRSRKSCIGCNHRQTSLACMFCFPNRGPRGT